LKGVSKFGEIFSLLFGKMLLLAMLQDRWWSGFHSGDRLYPSTS